MQSLEQICSVRIELDLSKNSRLKDMFRQPEFHREIKTYLRQYDLEIAKESTNPQGGVTSIEVKGSAVGLQSFIDRYLRSDVLEIAYTFVQNRPGYSTDSSRDLHGIKRSVSNAAPSSIGQS